MSEKINTKEAASMKKLEDVLTMHSHWKNNKSSPSHAMPEELWLAILGLLEQDYEPSFLRRVFGLSTQQYQKKYQQLIASPNASEPAFSQENQTEFAQVNIETSPDLTQQCAQTKAAIKSLKSTVNKPQTYLDNTTIVVECIREDGQRLKIHTVTGKLSIIMQAFFEQGLMP